ncbi:MAG: hypothetical protein IPK66_17415 [Rhodospirillales bacterium]|nr:hypothetical protein [Rhodospirillales bacterium]
MEFKEGRRVVHEIMNDLKKKLWIISVGNDFANGIVKSNRLKKIQVTLAAIRGCYKDMSLIKATSAIEISIPNLRFVTSQFTNDEIAKISRVIFGVLIHEYTHKIQEKEMRKEFAYELKLQRKFNSITTPLPNDWFKLYVCQPLEQEARANQAAAEVWEMKGPRLTKPNFNAYLKKTEVWKRTQSQIGNASSPVWKIRRWWKAWAAMAWSTYGSVRSGGVKSRSEVGGRSSATSGARRLRGGRGGHRASSAP